MSKHVFLILAHENEIQLQNLVRKLDSPFSDIFVHIDAKAQFDGSSLSVSQGKICLLPDRIDCRWGDFSLVEAELALIETATNNGKEYDYLHLISGVDYPLHGTEYIVNFCDENRGKEFIGFAKNLYPKELEWRTGRRFLFSRDFQSNSKVKRVFRKIHAMAQSLPGLGRKIDAEVKKGSQWCSFTKDFASYVLSRKDWIEKHFKYTFCPDEMVMQTLVWNSRFRENIYDTDNEFRGCMRYIPWENGYLRPLRKDDLKAMKKSDRFFGRKFNLDNIQTYERL